MLKCVELFAGAGGMALGLEKAGFKHSVLLDYDKVCCNVLKENQPKWNVIYSDLRNFKGDEFKGTDLLAGGIPMPPYPAISTDPSKTDDRNIFPEVLRLIYEMQPRAIFLNYPQRWLDAKFNVYRQYVLNSIQNSGYQVYTKTLNARDYGVSQDRPCPVIAAIRMNEPGKFFFPYSLVEPAPTAGEILRPFMEKNGWKKIKEWAEKADKTAPAVLCGADRRGEPLLIPGRTRERWDEMKINGRGIADAAPKPGYAKTPKLTVEMLAALQGFPSTWKFPGEDKTGICKIIGNALPPAVAKAVGIEIRNCLENRPGYPQKERLNFFSF